VPLNVRAGPASHFRRVAEVEIGSSNERPMTGYFPEMVEAFRAELPERCVVDGEIVLATATGPDFVTLFLTRLPCTVSSIRTRQNDRRARASEANLRVVSHTRDPRLPHTRPMNIVERLYSVLTAARTRRESNPNLLIRSGDLTSSMQRESGSRNRVDSPARSPAYENHRSTTKIHFGAWSRARIRGRRARTCSAVRAARC